MELKKTSLSDSLRMAMLLDLGTIIYRDQAKAARRYYEQTYGIARKNKSFYFMGKARNHIGAIYHYKQDYDSAMHFYRLADSLFNP